jgi:hypothetical protein
MPEADSAAGRAEIGRVDGDDGAKAAGAVRDEVDDLMIVEIGIIPRGLHVRVLSLGRRGGAIDGT